jgi:AcrR family transcriptional regulator
MPRSLEPASTEAILQATIALVGELGYERTSMDAVARRAGAGKATIYRRWPNKAQLVKAALDHYDRGRLPVSPDTGSLRDDLLALVGQLAALATPAHIALMHGLATAMRCDPELAAALQAHVQEEDQQPALPLVERAVARGEVWRPARPEVLDEVLEAMLIRQLQLGLPLDAAFGRHVVDHVLLPLLEATS